MECQVRSKELNNPKDLASKEGMYARLMDADHWFGGRRNREVNRSRARSRRDHNHDAAWYRWIVSRGLDRARSGLVPAGPICRFYLLYYRGDHYSGNLPPHSRPHRRWRPNTPRCMTRNPGKQSARRIFFLSAPGTGPLGIQVPRGLSPWPTASCAELTPPEQCGMLAP